MNISSGRTYVGDGDVLFEVGRVELTAEADASGAVERRLDDADQIQVLQRVRVPGTRLQVVVLGISVLQH